MARVNNVMPRVGHTPVADFLPPRIRELHAARWNRHKLAIATVVVSVFCAVGYFIALANFNASQAHLLQMQNATQRILDSEAKYADVISLTNQATRLDSALSVVHEKDIAWRGLLLLMQKSIPSGGRLVSFSLAGSPATESTKGLDPLTSAAVVVTADVTIESPTFEGVEYYLLDARQWPGYLSGSITGIEQRAGTFVGTLNVTLGKGALSSALSNASTLPGGTTK